MSHRLAALLLACSALAACSGNPFLPEGSDGGETPAPTPTPVDPNAPTTTTTTPAAVARDMRAFTFDGRTLTIDMTGVTASGQLAAFNRAPAFDIASAGGGQPGYQAFVFQETDLTRSYLAYVATNQRGNLVATASADGGQFNEHNSGGRYARLDVYQRPSVAAGATGSPGPERGLFSYAGTYAGVFVPGEWDNPANPRPPGLRPVAPWRVEGVAQINAEFSALDATGAALSPEVIEGGIVNRVLKDRAGNQIMAIAFEDKTIDTAALPDLSLRETSIDKNGEFLGNVEYWGDPGRDVGDYGGAFGGSGATDVAAVLWLNPIDGESGIWEYGTLNLPRCDLAGASPLCVPR